MRFFLPLLAALAATPALAGPPSDTVRAVQAAAGVAPLDAGAIRFTAVQPRDRGATIYEARRGPDGIKRVTIDLSKGDAGWAVDARDSKPVAAETLSYFSGRIDAAIAAAPSEAACPNGPDYYAEHGMAGLAGGGCDTAHPNAAIARALGLAEAVAP